MDGRPGCLLCSTSRKKADVLLSRVSATSSHTGTTLRIANQYHTSHDFPPDYPGRSASEKENGAGPEVWSRGGSCIVGPLGEVLAGPLWDEEGVIRAEVGLRFTTCEWQA